MSVAFVVTCEHASNAVPASEQALFTQAESALASHRGWDIGALELAHDVASAFGTDVVATEVTRLLVDTNRSERHRAVFSEYTANLDDATRAALLTGWWRPHRDEVERRVAAALLRATTVVHFSIHSFTPVWHGVERSVDLGLLYDPARPGERAFAVRWAAACRRTRPDLRARRNQPYRGTADGLATSLRRRFDAACYLGFEIEVSQRFHAASPSTWRDLRADVVTTLCEAADPLRP